MKGVKTMKEKGSGNGVVRYLNTSGLFSIKTPTVRLSSRPKPSPPV
jgi:hypothetical protein